MVTLRCWFGHTAPLLLATHHHYILVRATLFATLASGFLSYFKSNAAIPEWKQKQFQYTNNAHQELIGYKFRKKLASLNTLANIDAHLDHICIVRQVNSANHGKVATYIRETLYKLNYKVDFHEFEQNTKIGRVKFRNIIATLDPSASRRLVLACHYDSKIFIKFPFVGAVDSAVPCALMLDIAQTLDLYLKSIIKHSDVTLQLIFFDGEEAFGEWSKTDSLYGSKRLSSDWQRLKYPSPFNKYETNELDRIDLLVLLDLLGSYYPTLPNYLEVNFNPAYQLMARVEGALRSSKLLYGDYDMFNTRYIVNGSIEDDHVPFHAEGVRILHVIPTPFPRVWHTAQDDRRNLHKPTIENLSKILRIFVASYLRLKDS